MRGQGDAAVGNDIVWSMNHADDLARRRMLETDDKSVTVMAGRVM